METIQPPQTLEEMLGRAPEERRPDVLLALRHLKVHFPAGGGGWLDKITGGSPVPRVVKAVDGVSLDIYEGESLGLVGESGCGKSTLGRALLRLVELTEGEVFFRGTNLADLTAGELRKWRRHLQMIFQDPYASLNPRMTVGQIVGEPLETFNLASGQAADRWVQSLLEMVGLSKRFIKRYPHEFSGGQRQRIGIARALAASPDFIVADEPISALDVSIQAQIMNLLKNLQKQKRFACMFISHDLRAVRHFADRIAVMYLGRIVEVGPAAEVYGQPLMPYTKALISAVPVADPVVETQRQRVALSGEVPSALNPPSGCRFHTRCAYAIEACSYTEPGLQEILPGHFAACIRISREQPFIEQAALGIDLRMDMDALQREQETTFSAALQERETARLAQGEMLARSEEERRRAHEEALLRQREIEETARLQALAREKQEEEARYNRRAEEERRARAAQVALQRTEQERRAREIAEAERKRIEAEEAAIRAEKERLRQMEAEIRRREAEEAGRRQRAAAELDSLRTQAEEAERLRRDAAEAARRADDERLNLVAHASDMRLQEAKSIEEESARRRHEAENAARRAVEARLTQMDLERRQRAEELRLRQEEETRRRAEEQERLQREEEIRHRQSEIERMRRAEEQRLIEEEAERLRQEEEERLRLKAEAEQRQREAEESRREEEEAARARAEAERLRLQAVELERERQQRLEEELLKQEIAERQRAEEEERLRLKAEEEQQQRAEEELQRELEEAERQRDEAERLRLQSEEMERERLRREEEERLRLLEIERLKQEEEERLRRQTAEEQQQREAAEQRQRAAAGRFQAEEDERLRRVEEEMRLQQEEEENLRLADERRQIELERQLEEEAELIRQAEIEEQRQTEAAQQQRLDEERQRLNEERERVAAEVREREAELRQREEIMAAASFSDLAGEDDADDPETAEEKLSLMVEVERLKREAEEALRRQREAEEALKRQKQENAEALPPVVARSLPGNLGGYVRPEAGTASSAYTATDQTPPATEAARPDKPLFAGMSAPAPRRSGVLSIILLGLAAVALIGAALFVAGKFAGKPAAGDPATSRTPAQPATPQPTNGPPVAPAGMAYIPGGTFAMGRTDGDEYERPVHEVTVKPFFMDTYEVTNEDYAKYLAATNNKVPASWRGGKIPAGLERKPMTGLNYEEATAYVTWAGKRLPTEEEWEFAARGTDGRIFPWGSSWEKDRANANGAGKTASDVGSYPAGVSPFGIQDMSGNVWEWTSSAPTVYPGGKSAPPPPDVIVIRGGSYLQGLDGISATYRGWVRKTGDAYGQTGIRCVKDTP